MTTAQSELRQSILDRAFGFRFKECFAGFRHVDFQVLQIVLDVAFCGVAKVSEVREKAEAAGIRTKTIIAALSKLAEREMVFPCVDPQTGIECVEALNFDDMAEYMDVDDMTSLE
jgi:hypothetical protein